MSTASKEELFQQHIAKAREELVAHVDEATNEVLGGIRRKEMVPRGRRG